MRKLKWAKTDNCLPANVQIFNCHGVIKFLWDHNDVYFVPDQHVNLYDYTTDKIVHTSSLY
jgi:hypothetical protein